MSIFTYTLKVSVDDSKDYSLPQKSPAERFINMFPVSRGSVFIRLLSLKETVGGRITRRFVTNFEGECVEKEVVEFVERRPKQTRRKPKRKQPSTTRKSIYRGLEKKHNIKKSETSDKGGIPFKMSDELEKTQREEE